MSKFTFNSVQVSTIVLMLALACLLTACSSRPPINSEAFRWQQMIDSQRAQCATLPEPLASTCLKDVVAKEKNQPTY